MASQRYQPSKLYNQHVANLREIELALSHIARLARTAISSRDPQRSLGSLLRLYAFLVGAWAECRLRKLLHEPSGFQVSEREAISKHPQQLEQWKATIDVAFRKHYKIPKAQLKASTLGVAAAARYGSLHETLNTELKLVIEIRNKLAHGQWKYPLNETGTAVLEAKYRQINQENILSLEIKYSLVRHLADAIHDLVVSRETFERDFEIKMRKLFQARTNLLTRDYGRYEASLVSRRQQARASHKSGQVVEC